MLTKIARFLGIRTQRAFRMTLRGLLLAVGAGAGFTIEVLVHEKMYWWAGVPFAVLIVATITEFILGDIIAERSFPIQTEKKLALLTRELGMRAVESLKEKLQRMIGTFKACDQSRVSGTVHVLISLSPTPEKSRRLGLLQLTEYVGSCGGKKGRITTIEQGVIGRCVRTERIEHANFASTKEYQERMVVEFGFTRREANNHSSVARSYLAIPLSLDGYVLGVLYFFSTEPQVFPHAVERMDLESDMKDVVQILNVAAILDHLDKDDGAT